MAGYKDTASKSINLLILSTNNWDLKYKIQWHQKWKYLGLDFTKYVQDLYAEIYKTLMKKIK